MSEGTTRAVFAAFAGNTAIAITKGIAASQTGSGALLAETAHSIADALNQILLYSRPLAARRLADHLRLPRQ